ncbi:MAG: hypothetical protein EBZ00_07610, partial [Actinobacteria bacterium]|nr:hypothetical protein [Actinomycetota bacterium]
DVAAFPYLTSVTWTNGGLVIGVQSRDQRTLSWQTVDPNTGKTTTVDTESDDQWVELVPGSPVLTSDGTLIWCGERNGVRRLVSRDRTLTPDDLQVRSVVGASDTHVWVSANRLEQPEVLHTYAIAIDGSSCDAVTSGEGVHSSVIGGSTRVTRSASLTSPRARFFVSTGAELTNVAIDSARAESLPQSSCPAITTADDFPCSSTPTAAHMHNESCHHRPRIAPHNGSPTRDSSS